MNESIMYRILILQKDTSIFSVMIIRKKLYSIGFALLWIASSLFLLTSCKPSNEHREFVRSLDTTPETFERSYQKTGTPVSQILADTSTIFQPAQIRLHNNRIYLNDFADFTIYEYNLEGILTGRRIETTRGRGPGEVLHLTDFDVCGDTLWIADSQSLRISSFSLETGENIATITTEHRPMRVACLEDAVIVQWLAAELLFSKFDFEGNEMNQFGEIIEDQMMHPLSLDGSLVSNRKDRFVYLPFYAGLIYHYDTDGELINILKSPDGAHFPITKRDGPMHMAPDISYMQDGYIDENFTLYVYTIIPGNEKINGEWVGKSYSAIDIYDLVEGTYLESIRLPFHHSFGIYKQDTNTLFTTTGLERSYIHTFE